MNNHAPSQKYREKLIPVFLVLAIFLTIILVLGFGKYPIPPGLILKIIHFKILGLPVPPELNQAQVVLFSIRLPRIFLSLLVGSALSVSGAAYQGLFRNPMVAPDILGVSSGAGVGASLAIIWGWSGPALHLSAFLFGLLAVVTVISISAAVGRGQSLLILILVGVVVSSMFSAMGSFIKYLSTDDQSLATLVLWLMGSFAQSGSRSNFWIMALVLLVSFIPLYLARWQLNALAFGEEEAQSLGVDVKRLKFIVIASSTLMTASTVAFCGLIGWVGLIIPHLSRFLVGPNFRDLLPTAFLTGGLFMLIVDSVVRIALPGEMPVGIVTSLIGAPLFIYILCRTRKTWN